MENEFIENEKDNISVIDLAKELGKHKAYLFKVISRLGIEATKLGGGKDNRGQVISYVSSDDAAVLREAILGETQRDCDNDADENDGEDSSFVQIDRGVFYLILLEPDFDPGRFKVGFATTLSERVRQHRCSAPLLKVLKSWPCKLLWEKTAIDCVTSGCERLHTEVFRAKSINDVVAKCEQFFDLMPPLQMR